MQNAEFRMQNYHLARSLPAARGNENNLRFLRLFCLQVRRTSHTNLSFCILRSEICIPINRHMFDRLEVYLEGMSERLYSTTGMRKNRCTLVREPRRRRRSRGRKPSRYQSCRFGLYRHTSSGM